MSLPEAIPCPECRDAVAALGWEGAVSRFAVLELHWQHRPPHPNEVGVNHRRSARTAYDAWDAANPLGP